MKNNPWHILGIAATDDERTIKRAYAKALKALDPDDREAFIALREAYEAALQEAYWWQTEAEENGATDAVGSSPWATAYAEYTQADGLCEAYDAAGDAHGEEEDASQAASPQDCFLDECWQGWNESGSDAALLARLQAEYVALAERDLDTVLDYGDTLLEWFYLSENDAPRAFAWAADTYQWTGFADARLADLYERYPSLVNPRVASYAALAEWDENWQQGFWARLVQAIHPLRRGEAERDFQRFRRDSRGVAPQDLPASLQALYHLGERSTFAHIMSFLPLLGIVLLLGVLRPEADNGAAFLWLLASWLAYLLGAAIYETGKIAGWRLSRREWLIGLGCVAGLLTIVGIFSSPTEREASWLTVNLAAMLALYLAAVVWQRMVARQAPAQRPRGVWLEQAVFALILLTIWSLAYAELQGNALEAHTAFAVLPPAGAAFAYTTLRRTALSAQTRMQYVSALLQAAVLLPVFWAVLTFLPFNAQEGALYWVLRIYVITGIIALWLNPVYRQWHYALPTLLGLAAFIAFMAGLPPVWLIKLQLGLWILLPLAILATPRFPRLGFALPQTLRSFAQSILAIVAPLSFWHLGWYLAFAFSIGVMLYILWLDSELDEAMP
ncbi:MAG: J domain-containing protein [Cardiobacteriaceae bacterium]|nr:J domain-containing protein [Cardiobacteriaceae bacterium]